MCQVWLLPDTQDGQCPQIFHSFTVYVKGASPFERGDDGNDVDVEDDTNNDYDADEEEIPSRFVALPRVFLVSTTK